VGGLMKLGPRSNDHAHLMLCTPTALPAHMQREVVELVGLRTDDDARGQGWAIKLMQEVCAEMDKAGKHLFLHVDPPEGTDKVRLTHFYRRFGFGAIQADPLLMTRSPRFWMKGAGHG
jgi:ribosomal protein S18 acetylase RimI-like enzyme